jgi:WD40 repeat protein
MSGPVRLWDLPTGRERASIPNTGDTDRRAFLAPDGSWVLIHCMRMSLTLCDARTGARRGELRPPNETGTGHRYYRSGFRVSQDGRFIAADRVDVEAVGVWDTATGRRVAELVGARSPFAFSADGRTLWAATVAADAEPGTIAKLWEIETGRELLTVAGHRRPLDQISVSPDGRLLATGFAARRFTDKPLEPGQVKLWDTVTAQAIATLDNIDGYGFDFSPDSRLLVERAGSGHGLVWDVTETPPRNRDDLIAITEEASNGKTDLHSYGGPHYAPDGLAWFAMASDGRSIAVAAEPTATPRRFTLPRLLGQDTHFRANVWPPTPVFSLGGRTLAVPLHADLPRLRFNFNRVVDGILSRFRSNGRWSMVQVYDVATGKHLTATPPVAGECFVMGFTSDGNAFWTQRLIDENVPGKDATRIFEEWPIRYLGPPAWLSAVTILAVLLFAAEGWRQRRRKVALSAATTTHYPPLQGGRT